MTDKLHTLEEWIELVREITQKKLTSAVRLRRNLGAWMDFTNTLK